MLVEIEDKIISADIFKKKFVCDLLRCKGACCVEGDAGAPLSKEEVETIASNYSKIKPYLTPEGIQVIEQNGVSSLDKEGEHVTQLVNNGACAFVIYNEQQHALCAIEKAHIEGKIDNIKPISCSLYPIRVKKFHDFTALQYDQWSICQSACSHGELLGIPVYKFLKKPLFVLLDRNFTKN
jgi:Protein of unknown function (DUF3109)